MDQSTAESWMQEALQEARKAEAEGEVPVGALVLMHGKIVGRGHNHSIFSCDATAHAEILALRHAGQSLRNYRLPGSVLVVTLEPCVMCVGAMIQARVEQVVYGAADPKAGAIESHFQLHRDRHLNHEIDVMADVLAQECSVVLKEFFDARR